VPSNINHDEADHLARAALTHCTPAGKVAASAASIHCQRALYRDVVYVYTSRLDIFAALMSELMVAWFALARWLTSNVPQTSIAVNVLERRC
jgi:hypothetical protein